MPVHLTRGGAEDDADRAACGEPGVGLVGRGGRDCSGVFLLSPLLMVILGGWKTILGMSW